MLLGAGLGQRPMPIASLDEIRSKIGSNVGVSDWIEVSQDRIDQFAGSVENELAAGLSRDAPRAIPLLSRPDIQARRAAAPRRR